MSLQILIADDHGVVRKGLRAHLESTKGWKVCAEATDGRRAVEQAGIFKPDIAILDISMPQLNGLEAARQIRAITPHTEVLILSMHESDLLLRESLKVGAKGYLLKEDADDYLLHAVEALSQQKEFFSPKIAKAMAVEKLYLSKQNVERGVPLNRLTSREREVIQLLTRARATNKWRPSSPSASEPSSLTELGSCSSSECTPLPNSSATRFATRLLPADRCPPTGLLPSNAKFGNS